MSSSRPPLPEVLGTNPQSSKHSHRRMSSRSDSADILPGEELPEDTEDAQFTLPHETEESSVEGRQSEDSDSDVLWVDWDGPEDPMNPKNWSYRKKWAATLVVSSFTFISPISSSMVAPAASQIAIDFGITSTVLIAMTTSVFVLGFGKPRLRAKVESLADTVIKSAVGPLVCRCHARMTSCWKHVLTVFYAVSWASQ
jgi:hypothetical protein